VVLGYGLIQREIPEIPASLIVLMGASLVTGGVAYFQDVKKAAAVAAATGSGPEALNWRWGDLIRIFPPDRPPELSHENESHPASRARPVMDAARGRTSAGGRSGPGTVAADRKHRSPRFACAPQDPGTDLAVSDRVPRPRSVRAPTNPANAGVSILEMVVAWTLALVVLLCALGLLAALRRTFLRCEMAADAAQRLRIAMGSLVRDLRLTGYGVDPDIEVDNDPVSLINGKDPQLERAIVEVMTKLKQPVKLPGKPAPPIKTISKEQSKANR